MKGLGLMGLGVVLIGIGLDNKLVIVAGLLLLALDFVPNIRARGRKAIFWAGVALAVLGQFLPSPWGLPVVIAGSVAVVVIARGSH